MNTAFRSVFSLALLIAPATVWAQNLNPGNAGGGNAPLGVPTYGPEVPVDPALTTGSRFSVTASTPAFMNPTVAGATGGTVVQGDNSTISGDRRATMQQRTDGSMSGLSG
jgi:hypothetical protein